MNTNDIIETKDVYVYALGFCLIKENVSVAMIQRLMKINYSRAAMACDWMEQNGYITPVNGRTPRKVLITLEQYKEKFSSVVYRKKLIYKKYEKVK